MNKRAVLLVLLILVLSQAALAQRQGGASVGGIVLDRQGQRVPGLSVSLIDQRQQRRSAVTDRNGQFVFTGVAAGQVYMLEIYWGRELMYRQPKRIDRDTNLGAIRL
jgi:hypothetical protein